MFCQETFEGCHSCESRQVNLFFFRPAKRFSRIFYAVCKGGTGILPIFFFATETQRPLRPVKNNVPVILREQRDRRIQASGRLSVVYIQMFFVWITLTENLCLHWRFNFHYSMFCVWLSWIATSVASLHPGNDTGMFAGIDMHYSPLVGESKRASRQANFDSVRGYFSTTATDSVKYAKGTQSKAGLPALSKDYLSCFMGIFLSSWMCLL